jgi:hypothetical protein
MLLGLLVLFLEYAGVLHIYHCIKIEEPAKIVGTI